METMKAMRSKMASFTANSLATLFSPNTISKLRNYGIRFHKCCKVGPFLQEPLELDGSILEELQEKRDLIICIIIEIRFLQGIDTAELQAAFSTCSLKMVTSYLASDGATTIRKMVLKMFSNISNLDSIMDDLKQHEKDVERILSIKVKDSKSAGRGAREEFDAMTQRRAMWRRTEALSEVEFQTTELGKVLLKYTTNLHMNSEYVKFTSRILQSKNPHNIFDTNPYMILDKDIDLLFGMFDYDHNQSVSEDEVVLVIGKVLKSLNWANVEDLKMEEARWRKTFKQADRDANGRLDRVEFADFIKRKCLATSGDLEGAASISSANSTAQTQKYSSPTRASNSVSSWTSSPSSIKATSNLSSGTSRDSPTCIADAASSSLRVAANGLDTMRGEIAGHSTNSFEEIVLSEDIHCTVDVPSERLAQASEAGCWPFLNVVCGFNVSGHGREHEFRR